MGVKYFDWQRSTPGAPYKGNSPNLWALLQYMNIRWNVLNLGIYSREQRRIKDGTPDPTDPPSSHAFGAAYDCRYGNYGGQFRGDGNEIIQWLVDNYEALGVQMVIDYKNRRIWKSDRMAWKAHPKMYGGGDTRLHIESSKDDWFKDTPIRQRLGEAPPAPHIPITVEQAKNYKLKKGSGGNDSPIDEQEAVVILQRKLTEHGIWTKADGDFGPATDRSVRDFQKKAQIKVDGLVGPQTWGKLVP